MIGHANLSSGQREAIAVQEKVLRLVADESLTEEEKVTRILTLAKNFEKDILQNKDLSESQKMMIRDIMKPLDEICKAFKKRSTVEQEKCKFCTIQ